MKHNMKVNCFCTYQKANTHLLLLCRQLTLTPALAKDSEIARPIPLDAPVTIATLPFTIDPPKTIITLV